MFKKLIELFIIDPGFCKYFFSFQNGKTIVEISALEAIKWGHTYILSRKQKIPNNALDYAVICGQSEIAHWLLDRGFQISRLGFRYISSINDEVLLRIYKTIPRWWIHVEMENAITYGNFGDLLKIARPDCVDEQIIQAAIMCPYIEIAEFVYSLYPDREKWNEIYNISPKKYAASAGMILSETLLKTIGC